MTQGVPERVQKKKKRFFSYSIHLKPVITSYQIWTFCDYDLGGIFFTYVPTTDDSEAYYVSIRSSMVAKPRLYSTFTEYMAKIATYAGLYPSYILSVGNGIRYNEG